MNLVGNGWYQRTHLDIGRVHNQGGCEGRAGVIECSSGNSGHGNVGEGEDGLRQDDVRIARIYAHVV